MNKRDAEHLRALCFAEVDDFVIAVDGENLEAVRRGGIYAPRFMPFAAFGRENVAPEVFDLLRAAPIMYTGMLQIFGAAQELLNALDKNGIPENSPLRLLIENIQQIAILSQQSVREGATVVAEGIVNEMKTKGSL